LFLVLGLLAVAGEARALMPQASVGQISGQGPQDCEQANNDLRAEEHFHGGGLYHAQSDGKAKASGHFVAVRAGHQCPDIRGFVIGEISEVGMPTLEAIPINYRPIDIDSPLGVSKFGKLSCINGEWGVVKFNREGILGAKGRLEVPSWPTGGNGLFKGKSSKTT
jgi:hypothetical protein